jgi:3-hydroxyisobutyrate dehydrogenase-like beta-hydroxyacid dehydrogenase
MVEDQRANVNKKVNSVGILHPGTMGSSLGAALREYTPAVYWVSRDRSVATRERAESAGLSEISSLDRLVLECDLIVSVCPPAFAQDVAQLVAHRSFKGLFLDANAISPQKCRQIEQRLSSAGARFVDGSIIGPPAWKPGTTRLYLSGRWAFQVAEVFGPGSLEAIVLGEEVGKASALKMLYAAYTKGTIALIAAILAAAEAENVGEALRQEWSKSIPELAGSGTDRVRKAALKAWRFLGEMREITETMKSANLPGGFHRAAEEIYRRQSPFKNRRENPSLNEIISILRKVL